MYYHRTGFHPAAHENMAMRARKRYRLVQAANGNPNMPPADPSLWIIHYCQAERQFQMPSNRIPMNQHVGAAMTTRKFLQQHGQLVRKDFMLHDKNNYPTIKLPGGNLPQQYPGNVISEMNRSHPSYMMQQQAVSQGAMGPSPAKRQRQVGPSHAHGPSRSQLAMMTSDPNVNIDEEDAVNGDMMDTLTPRDISATRYIQHHEWMEEIFSSPYETSQIVPVELGLGRKGEIESLTRDFFETPTSSERNIVKGAVPPRVGRLEEGKASDFAEKATQRVAQLNAETETLKKKHARSLAKLRKGDAIKEAEQELRNLSLKKTGNDVHGGHKDGLVETLEKVQALLGKSIKIIKDVDCVQRGGLEEKSQLNDIDPQSLDLDQAMLDLPPQDSDSTPYHMQRASSNGEYTSIGPTSTGHTPLAYPQPPIPVDGAEDLASANETPGGDITMAEMPTETESKDADTEDWIMVDKEGGSRSVESHETPGVGAIAENTILESGFEAPADEANTAGDALESFVADQGGTDEFNPNDFHDTVDFDNLDAAGEGLSGFAEEANAELGLDEHGDLGLDNSAFGEAFHAPEHGEQHETGGGES